MKEVLRKVILQTGNKKYGITAASLILLAGILLWYRGEVEDTGILDSTSSSSFTVAIDPGHGGFDPGKVGVDGTLEKDINLSIALLLKEMLEKENYRVIITRTEDTAVGQKEGEGKKQEDMKMRVEIINESEADIAISVHQNSFTEESSKGAQVFYHPASEEGERLALLIQEKIKLSVKDDNHRQAKSNESYYMLKKTACPIVIVECGFLSNYAESALLNQKEYQKKVAEGIFEGVEAFFEENGIKENDIEEKFEANVSTLRELPYCNRKTGGDLIIPPV